MVTIIEDNNDFEYLQNSVKDSDSFWSPVYSDAYKHYTCNSLSFIYIYTIKTDLEFIKTLNLPLVFPFNGIQSFSK